MSLHPALTMTKDDGRASTKEAMSDTELLEQVLLKGEGGRGALEELLRRHYDWILRMSLFELSGATVAFDCAQEVLVQVAQGIDRFDGRSELRTWIFVIVRRTIWRYRKVEQQQAGRTADLGQADRSGQCAAEGLADSQLILSEDKRRLLGFVRELPEMQRHSVLLHYFEDLSVEDVARRLGCSVGSVKTHLFRARGQLKKKLG